MISLITSETRLGETCLFSLWCCSRVAGSQTVIGARELISLVVPALFYEIMPNIRPGGSNLHVVRPALSQNVEQMRA